MFHYDAYCWQTGIAPTCAIYVYFKQQYNTLVGVIAHLLFIFLFLQNKIFLKNIILSSCYCFSAKEKNKRGKTQEKNG